VGESDADPIIRKALALGGDEAIRINASPVESQFVAHQIAAIAKEGNYDLVVTGKETIDHNGSTVGGLIAGETELPYISLATKLDRQGNTLTITREIEGGQEVCEVEIPVVVSAQKGMAEARIPNMRGIMAARTKPLKVVEPIATSEYTQVIQFELPAPKSGVKLIAPDQVEELVRLLHEEAKVI
jgi:electron transfer flavoprotein beta subunit